MAKDYPQYFCNLLAWQSIESFSEDEQLDMLAASLGNEEIDGFSRDETIKAVELGVYDAGLILERIQVSIQIELQKARGDKKAPKWVIPHLERIAKLASLCTECAGPDHKANPSSPQREALPLLMFELGCLVQSANLGEPFNDAMKRKANNIKGADSKHDKPGGSRDLAAQIQAIWAEGGFTSRDICAEQEWQGLGFGSFTTARKALRNTPDPI
ncbi:hypothetical protein [Pseudomonas sp. TMP25]|uniref:hypothetical protein n=1 Tax=Pseudomonas sp. TMP25 TaxID=3136561 RepID=UPI003100D95F